MGSTNSNLNNGTSGNYYTSKKEDSIAFDVARFDKEFLSQRKIKEQCLENYEPPMELLSQKLNDAMKKVVNTGESSSIIEVNQNSCNVPADFFTSEQLFTKQYPNYSGASLTRDDKETIMRRTCEKYEKFLKSVSDKSSEAQIIMEGYGKDLLDNYNDSRKYACEFLLKKKI